MPYRETGGLGDARNSHHHLGISEGISRVCSRNSDTKRS